MGPMESWSDVILERVNDWSQIASLILLLLTLIAGLVVYFTQKEISRRAAAELEGTKQELLRKTSDRSLTEEQKQILQSALRDASGKVLVKADLLDSEAQMFASQIKSVFLATNLDVIEQHNTEIVALHAKGVRLVVNDINDPPPHTLPIQKAFQMIGIEAPASVSKTAKFPQDAVMVWICHK